MSINFFKSSDKHFFKTLRYIAISISITIIVVSFSIYLNFEKLGLDLLYTFSRDSLSEISYSSTFMSDTVKSLATNIYYKPEMSRLLFSPDMDYSEKSSALDSLLSFHITMPILHSIYIYNGSMGKIFSTLPAATESDVDSFFDKDIIKYLNNPGKYGRLQPIPRKLYDLYLPNNDKSMNTNVYTYIFYDIPTKDNKITHAVILNVYEEWMRNTISSIDKDPSSSTFIVDKNGTIVCGNKKNDMLIDLSKEQYIRSITSAGNDSGYQVENIEGIKSLVTYISPDKTGWKFIRIVPYNTLLSKLGKIKLITIVISFLIFLIGLCFSYFSSIIMYKPFKTMAEKISYLSAQSMANKIFFKQEFLRKALQNDSVISIENLRSKFDEYNIKLNADSFYQLIMLKVDDYKDFSSRFSTKERAQLKYEICNIVSEISGKYMVGEVLEHEQCNIIIILNVNDDLPDNMETTLRKSVSEIQKTVKAGFDISLSGVIGSNSKHTFYDLKNLYNEVLDSSQYRVLYGPGCIILADKIHELSSDGYIYPAVKEKQLIDALMLGKLQSVDEEYRSILDTASGYSLLIFNSVILRLVVSLNGVLENIQKTTSMSFSFNFNTFVAEVNKLESIEAINNKFLEMFGMIIKHLEDHKNNRFDVLAGKVIDIINSKYIDPNLSIDIIADMLSMSPAYLGRQFKKTVSMSVADYINKIRLETAKKLLETTSLQISEIVNKTGFSSSNFFYLHFKKRHGITPTEYRKNMLGKVAEKST